MSPWRSSMLCLLAVAAPLYFVIGAEERTASDPSPENVPFSSVESIFERRCYECHGAEKQKGGLRLDSREAAMAGGDTGVAFVPGKSADSLLIKMVIGADPDEVMPPKGDRLTEDEVSILRRWIDAGAEWPVTGNQKVARSSHWSFQPIKRTAPPEVKGRDWVRNGIDHFVLEKLEAEGVAPSQEASRTTLIRRLHLDILGMPPEPATAQAFVTDDRPDAYERAVDRILESPHYGEQWARHWLDLARYADTDGYEKDFYRPHAWRWRDWVINSINADQPFDDFTREQIAGDLMPGATLEQKVATGFHRNALLNREGGVDIEEDRTKIVVDRVSTVGTAWLGLTVGCAECHTHKYDPITQKEFYQLYAFFNSVDDRDIPAPLPQSAGGSSEQSALEAAKRAYVEADDEALEQWAAKVATLPDIWFAPPQEDYDLPTFGANNGANLYHQEDGSFLATGMVDGKCHYVMMLNTRTNGITGIRVEALTDEMLPKLGPGWSTNGNFILNEVFVETASLKDVSQLSTQRIASVAADYTEPGFAIAETIDGNHEKGGWAVNIPGSALAGLDRCAVYTLDEKIGHPEGMRLKVALVQQHGSAHTLGRVRVSYTTAPVETLAAHTTPERIKLIARKRAADRDLDDRVTLKRYYQSISQPGAPEFLKISQALADSTGIKGEVRAQALAERKTPRATHVHVRGNFMDKGARVEPATFAAMHPLKSASARPTRLDLAEWLVDPVNPLTARVAVNHVWRQLFGEGLVATMGDFGNQGEKPTHPELLDYLADDFMRNGWSRKKLIKRIVMSATYRQSSATRTDLLERDARNRWLARQNRIRLSGENARDQYLAASGILHRKIGGQSITAEKPRRGLYMQFKRAYPDYMLTAFDAPNSTASCPARERSNTPLQALTLMNDDLFMDCARQLAAQLESEEMESRVRSLFESCVARKPSAEEVADVTALLESARAFYAKDAAAAESLLKKKENVKGAAEEAAWVVVARAILNLDEVIMRE